MDGSAAKGYSICRILLEAVTELMQDFIVPSHLPGDGIIGCYILCEAFVRKGLSIKRLLMVLFVLRTAYLIAELEVFCLEGGPNDLYR
jgi:hypothetical protein